MRPDFSLVSPGSSIRPDTKGSRSTLTPSAMTVVSSRFIWLAASNLMAQGYGCSNEGDVHTCAIVGAAHHLVGDGHFTEMYSLDFEKDSALMSHMGEGNWKVARKDRPIRLIDRSLEIGGLENPPTLVFSEQLGPGTIVSLVTIAIRGTGS